jgi:hypothetical protein
LKHIAVEHQKLLTMQLPDIHHPMLDVIQVNLGLSLGRLKQSLLHNTLSSFEGYELERVRESLAYRIREKTDLDEKTRFELEACYALIKRLVLSIHECHAALDGIVSPGAFNNKTAVAPLMVTKRHVWPIDVLAAKHAIKITLGIFWVIWSGAYLGWPAGIQSMIAVIVMTAQPNLGRAHLRFNLRFWGVLIGSALGLLGLMMLSHFLSFSILLILIFISMFVSAYIAQGPESIAYFGLQMGVMIPLVLLFHNGPTVDMTFAIQRFVGVLEAALVSAFILYYIWPTQPLIELKRQLMAGLSHAEIFFKRLSLGETEDLKKEAVQIEQHNQQLLVDAQFLLFGDTREAALYAQLIRLMDDFALQIYAFTRIFDALPKNVQDVSIKISRVYIKHVLSILKAQHLCLMHKEVLCDKNLKEITGRLIRHVGYFSKKHALPDVDQIHIAALTESLLQISAGIDKVSLALQPAGSPLHVRDVTSLS